jgi:hypothetical protein
MHNHREYCLWVLSVVCGSLFFCATCSAQAAENKARTTQQSVTGCLQKGDEAGGFTIDGSDGRVWELYGKRVQLSEHIGHTVTLTGSAVKESKATEEKMESSEKKEASGKEYSDPKVDSLKMVSDSCK